MAEVWRDIPGFEGFYQGSTEGRIKSLPHFRNNGSGGYIQKGKILKPGVTKDYYRLGLSKNGILFYNYVHTFIALTFPEICGEPFPGAEVNHLNEDKHDNRAVNLRWSTHKDNVNWGTGTERMIKNRNGKNSRKPVLQYTLDGEFVAEYPSIREAQRQTGFDQANISTVILGQRKTAYGFIWKLK